MTGCPLGYLLCSRETFGFLFCLCRTLGPRHLALELRYLALGLAEKAGILDLLPFRIRVVGVQAHVNAPLDPGVRVRLHAANGDTKLAKIAVRSPNNAHTFDGGQGIGSRRAEWLVWLQLHRLHTGANEA